MFDLCLENNNYIKTNEELKEFKEYFLKKEEKAIYDILKKRIVNYSIEEQNIFKYSEFKSSNNLSILDEKKFDEIFDEMTNKNIQTDGQINFSLKNELIKQFDLDYILNPLDISDAQKYIIEFKKQDISLLNNYFYQNFDISKKVNTFCFYNFFYFNNNIELLIDFCVKLLGGKDYSNLNDIFFFCVSKLIIIFIYVDKNIVQKELLVKKKKKFYEEIKEKLNKILDCLKVIGIENNDEEKIILYKYLETNILQYLDIKKQKEQDESNKNGKKENMKLRD